MFRAHILPSLDLDSCTVFPGIGKFLRAAYPAAILTLAAALLSGCSSLGSSGPRGARVAHADGAAIGDARIRLVNLTEDTARHIIAAQKGSTFAEAFGDGSAAGPLIGNGDTIDISIWEAPPATLFGSAGGAGAIATSAAQAPVIMQNSNLPQQMVADDGTIAVPFVGSVMAAGRTPKQVEQSIVANLRGKAHLPQVMVRVTNSRSTSVTVVGDVATSTALPLTSKGERLLDALASAGGVKQPVGKITLRLSRGQKSISQSLESVLIDPSQNISLQPGDVLTALYQPYSFTALGAVGNNAEVPFEGTGLTLAQALGRIGGLQDNRADTRGVFIFRLEDPNALALTDHPPLTPDGRLPVIYKVNLNDPGSFFVAQSFPIRNGDVIYVSNAPLADLQKFVTIVASMAYSIIGITNAVQ